MVNKTVKEIKIKKKRLSKGQRTHLRRMKQETRNPSLVNK